MTYNQEEQRLAITVKNTLAHIHKMFKLHIQYEQHEDAMAIGDEYLEWIKDLDNEEIFYYHQEELEEMICKHLQVLQEEITL